jgi:hypothetical protein
VREVLAEMFPQGAVTPDDPAELLARTRAFLRDRPLVPRSAAFLLQDSLERHLQLYRSVCHHTGPEVRP